MGMTSIMKAKKIILVANGKEEILEKAFSGEIDPQIPASILQLHNDVTIIHSPV
jgi:glucosamine-6-phosphate deaminase